MTKRKIEKYVIHGDWSTRTWWARVPWGTFQPFSSWDEAAAYLAVRHRLKTEHKPYRRSRHDPGQTTVGA